MAKIEALIKTLEMYSETNKPISQKFYQGLCLKAIEKLIELQDEVKRTKETLKLFRQDEPSAEEENKANTKPCPYNKNVPCVQYPDDGCGCNPCEECEIKLKAEQPCQPKGEVPDV